MMMLWYTDSFTCPPDILELSVVVSPTLSAVTTISSLISTTPTNTSQYSSTMTSISDSSAFLNTAAVAGTTAAVAVSALLLIFICTLVLAITLVKARHKKIRTLDKTPFTSINVQDNALTVIVQGKKSCMITSHVEDDHFVTIVNTESNLACGAIDMSYNAAYGEVEKKGNANMPINESIEESCSRRFNNESAGLELVSTGSEVSILLNGEVILSDCRK